MNIAKNWALTIMLIALAFAHFSSELLLKEQMIIPVKKTLNNAGHIDAKLIDFSEICQKKSNEIGCFLPIVSCRSFPWNFQWDRPIFVTICPWKSFEIWLCSAKIPRNRPIFLRFLTFLPLKSREIGWFFCEFWLFSCENPAKLADFSANLPVKIPRNFALFPAKYQKPWLVYVFPKKKVTYLGGQVGDQAWKFSRHCVKAGRIGDPTGHNIEPWYMY